jgi:hypothetical protein
MLAEYLALGEIGQEYISGQRVNSQVPFMWAISKNSVMAKF